MSVTPGTRLGPYEITAQIGEGGMGLFYVPAAANPIVMVNVQTRPAVAFGSVTALERVPSPGLQSGSARGYDGLPDGGFVTATDGAGGTGERPELRVIPNWIAIRPAA